VRRAVAAAVTSVLCSLALTACSNGADTATPARPSTTSPSTAPTTTHPDTSQRPTEPVMPALAKRHSTAGAKAFIRYFVAVLNYSHRAHSTRRLRTLSAKDCLVCTVIARSIDAMRKSGGEQTGAAWKCLGVASLPGTDPTQRNFVAHIHISGGETRRSQGAVTQTIKESVVYDDFFLLWRARTWLVHDLRPA
jgi:hypothetical protein